jgi:hypothetical protein
LFFVGFDGIEETNNDTLLPLKHQDYNAYKRMGWFEEIRNETLLSENDQDNTWHTNKRTNQFIFSNEIKH